MYNILLKKDASLIEINPLVVTKSDEDKAALENWKQRDRKSVV